MGLLNYVNMPIYIASFVLLAYQYYRTSAEYFDFNLKFALMSVILVLMFVNIFVSGQVLALVLFALALLLLAASIYLFRRMSRAD